MFITKVTEAEDNASWKHENEELEIHEKGGPGCRLMLRYRCNDRDVPTWQDELILIKKDLSGACYFLAYPVSQSE